MRLFRRSMLVGLAALAPLAGLASLALYRGLRGGWTTLGAATHLPSIGGDVFFLNVPHLVRRGPPRLVVVRLEQPVTLVPHHFEAEQLGAPLPIEEWAQILGTPLVFNAGQFDERQQHLGWLRGSGQWLMPTRKPAWMALLVSGAPGSGAGSRVVDLEQAGDPRAVAERYDNIVQSMMLVDEGARVRVRRSELAACRTVVAEDRRGRLLVIASEGAVTLQDMAAWLPRSGLDIVRAMNLDGGIESQLAINTPELTLTAYGQYGTGASPFQARQLRRFPLPAVVALQPRGRLAPRGPPTPSAVAAPSAPPALSAPPVPSAPPAVSAPSVPPAPPTPSAPSAVSAPP